MSARKHPVHMSSSGSRDLTVVSTLRCGRNNPGSNPGHGTLFSYYAVLSIFFSLYIFIFFPTSRKLRTSPSAISF